jgi:hypothetical protein
MAAVGDALITSQTVTMGKGCSITLLASDGLTPLPGSSAGGTFVIASFNKASESGANFLESLIMLKQRVSLTVIYSCNAAAKVVATFLNCELLFCGHHARNVKASLQEKSVNIYDPENEIGLIN